MGGWVRDGGEGRGGGQKRKGGRGERGERGKGERERERRKGREGKGRGRTSRVSAWTPPGVAALPPRTGPHVSLGWSRPQCRARPTPRGPSRDRAPTGLQ